MLNKIPNIGRVRNRERETWNKLVADLQKVIYRVASLLDNTFKDHDSKKCIDYMIIFNNKTNAKTKRFEHRQTLLPTNHFTDFISFRVVQTGKE